MSDTHGISWMLIHPGHLIRFLFENQNKWDLPGCHFWYHSLVSVNSCGAVEVFQYSLTGHLWKNSWAPKGSLIGCCVRVADVERVSSTSCLHWQFTVIVFLGCLLSKRATFPSHLSGSVYLTLGRGWKLEFRMPRRDSILIQGSQNLPQVWLSSRRCGFESKRTLYWKENTSLLEFETTFSFLPVIQGWERRLGFCSV